MHSGVSSSARPQIEFKTLSTPIPLHAAIQEATLAIYRFDFDFDYVDDADRCYGPIEAVGSGEP